MSPEVRKALLSAHVVSSVGWVGALMVFTAHAAVSVWSADGQTVQAACMAMALAAWFVILPLAFATLVTGLVHALETAWGLLDHYWIIFKHALTALATSVLLLKLSPIDSLAQAAAAGQLAASGSRTSVLVHA